MADQLAETFSRPICAVVGSTATGKTDLSIGLAERAGCEILCVDAMQVYRGLDIGTAKPTPSERNRVVHHGLDLVSPLENFNASRFAQYAEPILENTDKNHRPLILCGGTGLYYRALLQGFFTVPDPDASIRHQLQERQRREGCEFLYAELQQCDPDTAETIHPNDARRIIRALEIIRQTGMTVTLLRKRQKKKPWMARTCFIGIRRDRRELEIRIEKRTKWMYDNGLQDETLELMQLGCTEKNTALQALGYKECFAYLGGEITYQEALKKTIQGTKRYAKRQMTWFRRQFPTNWLYFSSEKEFEEIVIESLQLWMNNVNNIPYNG